MEEFSHSHSRHHHMGGGSNARATTFMYLPSAAHTTTASSPSTSTQQPPPPTTSSSFYSPNPNHHHHHHHTSPKPEPYAAAASRRLAFSSSSPSDAPAAAADEDAIKAKIVSHPQYPSLLGAYMDCQKVGAPSEVAARLSTVAREIVARQQHAAAGCRRDPTSAADAELDQFMEAYCNMLVKYREELTRPLQEAMDFLRRVESQLNSVTNGATASIFTSTDDKCEGVGSSEEDQDAGSGGEAEHPEMDPRAEDKELKHHLLKKYSGYLSSLRHELSKKKKKGKLPKEARQKLLNWWELHYKWPYPSETEKVALAESTGLDQKQINNWFINQRKRHWKPSEDMQFVVMDAFHPPNAAAFYMGGQFMGDGSYRLGP